MALSKKQTDLVNDYRTMFTDEHDRETTLDNETILKIVTGIKGGDDMDDDRIAAMLKAEPNGDGEVVTDTPAQVELTGEALARMAQIEYEQSTSAKALAVRFDAKANQVAREVVAAGKKWKGGAVLVRKELLRLYGKPVTINETKFVDLPEFPNVDSEKGSNKFPPGPNGLFDRYPGTRENADGERRQTTLSWYNDFVEGTAYGKELKQSDAWKIGKDVAYKNDMSLAPEIRAMPVPDMRERKSDDKTDYAAFKNSVKKAVRFHTKVRDAITYLGDKITVFVSEDMKSQPVRILQKSNGNLDMFTLQQVQQIDWLAVSTMGGENIIANIHHALERDRKQPTTKASQGFDRNMSVGTLVDGFMVVAQWSDSKSDLGTKHVGELRRALIGEGSDARVLAVASMSKLIDAVWTDDLHNRAAKLLAELDKLDGAERAAKIAALTAKEADKPAAAAA